MGDRSGPYIVAGNDKQPQEPWSGDSRNFRLARRKPLLAILACPDSKVVLSRDNYVLGRRANLACFSLGIAPWHSGGAVCRQEQALSRLTVPARHFCPRVCELWVGEKGVDQGGNS